MLKRDREIFSLRPHPPSPEDALEQKTGNQNPAYGKLYKLPRGQFEKELQPPDVEILDDLERYSAYAQTGIAKTSETFRTHADDLTESEKANIAYLEDARELLNLQYEIVGFLESKGLTDANVGAARLATEKALERVTEAAWSNIPTLNDEKARRSSKWLSTTHYDRYWRPWADELKLLSRDALRAADQKLTSALDLYCRRNDLESSRYLPPTKSERIDFLIANPDIWTAEEAHTLASTASTRRSKTL